MLEISPFYFFVPVNTLLYCSCLLVNCFYAQRIWIIFQFKAFWEMVLIDNIKWFNTFCKLSTLISLLNVLSLVYYTISSYTNLCNTTLFSLKHHFSCKFQSNFSADSLYVGSNKQLFVKTVFYKVRLIFCISWFLFLWA